MRIIACCGPKGGIGTSSCAVAFARALSGRDRRVLIADCHRQAPGLRYFVDMPNHDITAMAAPTLIKNIDIMRMGFQSAETENQIQHFREMPYDDVILDLDETAAEESCSAFLLADLPILIAGPDPASIDVSVRWLRHLINRHIAAKTLDAAIIQLMSPILSSWEFTDIYPKLSPDRQALFVSSLSCFKCAFLLNQRRDTSEALQSMALCHALGMVFGIDLVYLGSLAYDERRWFYERRLGDVSIFVHEDPMVRGCDEIAREKFAPGLFDETRECLPLIQAQQHPWQFLRAASSTGARQIYRRLWEGYCRDNGLVSLVMRPETISHTLTLLETAWKSAECDGQPAVASSMSAPAVSSRELPSVSREFPNVAAAVKTYDPKLCDENAGIFLKNLRASAGLSINQLAIKSRIPAKTIEHLESQDVSGISAARLQAYLYEMARCLNADFDEIKRKFGLIS